jgi:hypothetical protein
MFKNAFFIVNIIQSYVPLPKESATINVSDIFDNFHKEIFANAKTKIFVLTLMATEF